MTHYIGIDPGASGGIAVLGDPILDPMIYSLNHTPKDIAEWLRFFEGADSFCFLERVHSMPKQGVSSTFKFGWSAGFVEALLVALNIPFEKVPPQRWQKAMGCLTRGDKNVSKQKAQELFPALKVTHWCADALLLAEYCRRCSHDTQMC